VETDEADVLAMTGKWIWWHGDVAWAGLRLPAFDCALAWAASLSAGHSGCNSNATANMAETTPYFKFRFIMANSLVIEPIHA
jgi:hypothetical protein